MTMWDDKTNRHTPEVVESSTLRLGALRVEVHHHIYHEPDAWLVSCSAGQSQSLIEQKVLASRDLNEAKEEALEKVAARLRERIAQDEAALAEIATLNKDAR